MVVIRHQLSIEVLHVDELLQVLLFVAQRSILHGIGNTCAGCHVVKVDLFLLDVLVACRALFRESKAVSLPFANRNAGRLYDLHRISLLHLELADAVTIGATPVSRDKSWSFLPAVKLLVDLAQALLENDRVMDEGLLGAQADGLLGW